MAENWKNLSAETFKAVYTGWNNDRGPNGSNVAYDKVSITLQYDYNSLTTTSAKVRFKLDRENADDTYEYFDIFYLIYSTTSKSKVTYYTLKDEYTINKTNTYPHYSTSLTLTKAAHEKFTIPEFWFCNDGYDNSDRNYLNGYSTTFKERLYNNYNDNGTRESFRSVHSKKSISIVPSITEVGTATAGTVTLTDTGKNSCLIHATPGSVGANDTWQSSILYFDYGNQFGTTPTRMPFTHENLSDGYKEREVFPPEDIKSDETQWHIVAKVDITGMSGKTATSVPVTRPIKHYSKPRLLDVPVIEYSKNKLTNKEDWIFKWKAAVAGNDNSPVKGYRIKLLKNYQLVPFTLTASGYITNTLNSTSLYFDLTDSIKHSEEDYWFIKIKPSDFDFKKGDTVCLSVQAYTKNGANEYLFSTVKSSSHYVVESAGTVRVKVYDSAHDEAWTEGQVFVKVYDSAQNEVWVEADDVNIKVYDNAQNEVWVTSE